jgi:hypothetical protein
MLLGLWAATAHAAQWQRIADNKMSTTFVDTKSIERTGDIVAMWYRRDFKRPMTREKQGKPYRSSEVMMYYNCAENEAATARWIAYEKIGAKGRIIFDEKVAPLAYADVATDEGGRALYNFACKAAK